jgi:hypothetical protein
MKKLYTRSVLLAALLGSGLATSAQAPTTVKRVVLQGFW